MTARASRLAQVLVSPAATEVVYQAPPEGGAVEITRLHIVNVGFSSASFAIWHDDEGTDTFDNTTLIQNFTSIGASPPFVLEAASPSSGISLAPGGQLAVGASESGTFNVTVYGYTASRIG